MTPRPLHRRSWTAWILAVVALTVAAGCSESTRYRILSTFFDGVPSPETRRQWARADSIRRVERRRWKIEQAMEFRHGPFAANECGACHATGGTRSFRTSLQGESPSLAGAGGTGGARLILPAERLCTYCHTEKSVEALSKEYRYLHGPTAAGECSACHHPHHARYTFNLRRDPKGPLCTECHGEEERGFAHRSGLDTSGAGCTACHDPHGANREFFIRPDASIPSRQASLESRGEVGHGR
jgi:predicted CXXCH cytochrome family protein